MLSTNIPTENNRVFQEAVKELGLEGRQLTKGEMRQVFNYMQEVYCLEQ